MSAHPPKQKRCAECRQVVDATTLRPLSRTVYGSGLRYACPGCFVRVKALRKVAREARLQVQKT